MRRATTRLISSALTSLFIAAIGGVFAPEVGSTVEISHLPGEPDSARRTDVDKDWLRWFVIGGGIDAWVHPATRN